MKAVFGMHFGIGPRACYPELHGQFHQALFICPPLPLLYARPARDAEFWPQVETVHPRKKWEKV